MVSTQSHCAGSGALEVGHITHTGERAGWVVFDRLRPRESVLRLTWCCRRHQAG